MVCHLVELQKVKSTKELSVVSPRTSVKVVKPTDAVLSLTEPVTLCSTLFSAELLVTTVYSS